MMATVVYDRPKKILGWGTTISSEILRIAFQLCPVFVLSNTCAYVIIVLCDVVMKHNLCICYPDTQYNSSPISEIASV